MSVTGDTLVFVAGLTCIDLVNPDTMRSAIGNKTLEEIQKKYPGATIDCLGPFIARKEKALCTEPEEITEEKWTEMLEVLPPENWKRGKWQHNDQELFCSAFDLMEYTSGRVTCICVRIGDRHFWYQGIAGQSLEQRCWTVACSAAFKKEPCKEPCKATTKEDL